MKKIILVAESGSDITPELAAKYNIFVPPMHVNFGEETFDAAQVILDENKRKFDELGLKAGMNSRTTCLGGFIYCARCGARYNKVIMGTKKYGFKDKYGCYSRHKKIRLMVKDPNCKNRYYLVDELDNIVFNEIKKLAVDPDYIQQIKKESEKDSEVQQIHAIEKQIKSISAQISRFMDLYGVGKYNIDELDEKTAPLQDQRDKLMAELKKLQADSNRITDDQVLQIVSSFDEVLEQGDLQDKRSIIEQLINRIDIDGDDITINWNFI